MRCPVDNETLVMADRSGVEIDYCPKCRGVWLDRGELDKIIDRAQGAQAPAAAAPVILAEPGRAPQAAEPAYQRPEKRDRDRDRDDDDDDRRHGHHKKRRESFLSELFDF